LLIPLARDKARIWEPIAKEMALPWQDVEKIYLQSQRERAAIEKSIKRSRKKAVRLKSF